MTCASCNRTLLPRGQWRVKPLAERKALSRTHAAAYSGQMCHACYKRNHAAEDDYAGDLAYTGQWERRGAILVGIPPVEAARPKAPRRPREPGQPRVAPAPPWTAADLTIIAARFDVDASELLGRRRTKDLARARRVLSVMARRHGLSLPEIGALLGRDHTTVMQSLRVAADDPEVLDLADALIRARGQSLREAS